ncbi:hypothetical protein [Herbidospora sp. NBRC 101105]|uniref:hypothetical protein n=1 Tax=Herbidospora sp. NBRC 101105 TaxID=3032195 RepID=UPI002552CDB8|nr:hypothetical protein [Herbidospora sp. NBRC 101105]
MTLADDLPAPDEQRDLPFPDDQLAAVLQLVERPVVPPGDDPRPLALPLDDVDQFATDQAHVLPPS